MKNQNINIFLGQKSTCVDLEACSHWLLNVIQKYIFSYTHSVLYFIPSPPPQLKYFLYQRLIRAEFTPILLKTKMKFKKKKTIFLIFVATKIKQKQRIARKPFRIFTQKDTSLSLSYLLSNPKHDESQPRHKHRLEYIKQNKK